MHNKTAKFQKYSTNQNTNTIASTVPYKRTFFNVATGLVTYKRYLLFNINDYIWVES